MREAWQKLEVPLRGLFWCAAAFALLMASLPKPPQLPGSPSDKIQHIVAFGVLAALASAGYRQLAPWKIGVGLSLLGALIELIQMVPTLNRDAEVLDWVADTTAAAFVLLLSAAIRRASS